MKILVVSNLYPPQHLGGYEIGCRDIVEKLRARGHSVRVLTSSFRLDDRRGGAETDVERTLYFRQNEGDPGHHKVTECRKVTDVLRRFRPDVIMVSNLAGLSFWLPLEARRCGYRTVFLLSDTSFVSWRVAAWGATLASGRSIVAKAFRALFRRTFLIRGWPVMQNQASIFTSRFLWNTARQAGIRIARDASMVVHWGVALETFENTSRNVWPPRRLLFVGRISPQKGVHTAIAAVSLLAGDADCRDLSITLAGAGPDHEYIRQMHELPATLGISDRVTFLGNVPRETLPQIYGQHDVLIFPSEWDEPFAITPLEAIACGLAVVGTVTGGTGEIFRDRETAMTFVAGDARDCARAIRELCTDQKRYEAIRKNAREELVAQHTLDAMVDQIEHCLGELSH